MNTTLLIPARLTRPCCLWLSSQGNLIPLSYRTIVFIFSNTTDLKCQSSHHPVFTGDLRTDGYLPWSQTVLAQKNTDYVLYVATRPYLPTWYSNSNWNSKNSGFSRWFISPNHTSPQEMEVIAPGPTEGMAWHSKWGKRHSSWLTVAILDDIQVIWS